MGVRAGSFNYWGRRGSAFVNPPPPSEGPQFYASPAGGGTGLSVGSPCLISQAWALMAPVFDQDPFLNLANGTYTGANSMIAPSVSGTSASYITVRATNEGQVLIDGQSARIPVNLNQVDYINIIGVNCKASSADVVALTGCISCLIQRVCAWDAADQNRYIFVNNYGRANVFEDCAGWGIARKVYISYANAGPTTFRRVWHRWNKSTQLGPKPGASLAYHSYDVTMENCIGTWDQTPQPDPYTLQNNGVAVVQGNPPGSGCDVGPIPLPYGVVQGDQSCLVNSKFVQNTYGVFSSDSNADTTGIVWNPATNYPAAPRSQAVSTIGGNAYYSLQTPNINHQPDLTIGVWWNLIGPLSYCNSRMLGCIAYQKTGQSNIQPARLFFNSLNDGVTYQDCVGIYSNDVNFGPTTPFSGTTRQPFLLSNGTINSGLVATRLTSFRGQASNGSVGTAYTKTNLILTGTTPAALYTGPSESLYNTAQGAQIRYRYVNGVLTSDALWPWPMSARIAAATAASGYAVEDVDATIQAFFGTYI